MAVVLAVVMLIYGIYLSDHPDLAADMPLLVVTTLIFGLLGGLAALASVASIRSWPHRLWWDGALIAALPLSLLFLWQAYA
jgi:hypothetical protein